MKRSEDEAKDRDETLRQIPIPQLKAVDISDLFTEDERHFCIYSFSQKFEQDIFTGYHRIYKRFHTSKARSKNGGTARRLYKRYYRWRYTGIRYDQNL